MKQIDYLRKKWDSHHQISRLRLFYPLFANLSALQILTSSFFAIFYDNLQQLIFLQIWLWCFQIPQIHVLMGCWGVFQSHLRLVYHFLLWVQIPLYYMVQVNPDSSFKLEKENISAKNWESFLSDRYNLLVIM